MSDVDAALARAEEDRHWTTRTSGTASSWAFEDRAVLAAEVKRLRELNIALMLDLRESEERYQKDMREAGRDLAEAARNLDYAERRLKEQGSVW